MADNDKQFELGVNDETIAKRAYALWEGRGCPLSDGADDWQLAKRQLSAEAHHRQRPLLRILNRLRRRVAL
jgi:hypothetical protein